jgi:hypothetical protein
VSTASALNCAETALNGQLHTPTNLLPGKEPVYPPDRGLDGCGDRCGRRGEQKKFPPPVFETVGSVVSHYSD